MYIVIGLKYFTLQVSMKKKQQTHTGSSLSRQVLATAIDTAEADMSKTHND
jgi:hypothetical protein